MEAFGHLMKRERDFFIDLVVRTARRYREIVHARIPCNSNSKSTGVVVDLETIKLCAECTELHGQPSIVKSKHLVMVGAGVFQGECREEHYECSTCGAAFARVLAGENASRVWLAVNSIQH